MDVDGLDGLMDELEIPEGQQQQPPPQEPQQPQQQPQAAPMFQIPEGMDRVVALMAPSPLMLPAGPMMMLRGGPTLDWDRGTSWSVGGDMVVQQVEEVQAPPPEHVPSVGISMGGALNEKASRPPQGVRIQMYGALSQSGANRAATAAVLAAAGMGGAEQQHLYRHGLVKDLIQNEWQAVIEKHLNITWKEGATGRDMAVAIFRSQNLVLDDFLGKLSQKENKELICEYKMMRESGEELSPHLHMFGQYLKMARLRVPTRLRWRDSLRQQQEDGTLVLPALKQALRVLEMSPQYSSNLVAKEPKQQEDYDESDSD